MGLVVPMSRFGGPLRWYHHLTWRFFGLLRAVYPMRVVGAHRIPRRGPAVLIAPHAAYTDSFPFLYLATPRPARFLGSAFFVARDVLPSWGFFAGGVVPARRDRPDPLAVRRVLRLLAAGELVAFFPEGGRNWTGVPQLPMPSAAKLLARLRVPVFLLSIDGGYDQWPRWDTKPRIRPVTVRVHGPLDLAARPEGGRRELGRGEAGGQARAQARAPGRARWWHDIYASGGRLDVAEARAGLRDALRACAARVPASLDLRRPGRLAALPRLLCFCPDCAQPATGTHGRTLRCAACGARWGPDPRGALVRDPRAQGGSSRDGGPGAHEPVHLLFARMLERLAARNGDTRPLVEPVQARELGDQGNGSSPPAYVAGEARLDDAGLVVTAGGGRRWSLPLEAVAQGAMEGADVLELRLPGGRTTLELHGSPGAFRLLLDARARLHLPYEDMTP